MDVQLRPVGANSVLVVLGIKFGSFSGYGSGIVRIHRQRENLLRTLEAEFVDQLLRHHFGLEVGGMGVMDKVNQRHQICHRPGFGRQTGKLQLQRVVSGVAVDIAVDAIHVVLEKSARSGIQFGRMAVTIAADAQHPHADVAGQGISAKGGSQLAPPGGAEKFHLHQPVLRGDKALRANQIRSVGRINVGNTQFITQHGDGSS